MKEFQSPHFNNGVSYENNLIVSQRLGKMARTMIEGARRVREAARLTQFSEPIRMILEPPRKRNSRSFVPFIGETPSLVPREYEEEVFERLAFAGDPGAVLPFIEDEALLI